MQAALHALSCWSAPAAGALVASIWEGVLLALAVALGLRLLPGLSAAARSIVWSTVFLLVVLLPFASLYPSPAASPTPLHPAHQVALNLGAQWSIPLACLWLACSLLRGLQLATSAVRLHRIARTAIPLPGDSPASFACATLLHTGRLASRRPVTLCTSLLVDRPGVIGFFTPRILLPPALINDLPPADIEQIVLHEMEHLRRRDDWSNLAQKLALVLFPLNPALLWVERQLCLQRELACDDGVLRTTHARKAYATCLARLAEYSLINRGISLALNALEKQSQLAHRVHRILRAPASSMGAPQSAAAVSLMMMACLAGAGTLAHTHPLVRFTPSSPAPSTTAAYTAANPAGAASTRLVNTRMHTSSAAILQDAVFHPAQPASSPYAGRENLEPAMMARTGKSGHPNPNGRQAIRSTGRFQSSTPARKLAPAIRPAHLHRGPSIPAATASTAASSMMLTNWHQVPPASTVRLLVTYTYPAYAAVPVVNGWLIVEL